MSKINAKIELVKTTVPYYRLFVPDGAVFWKYIMVGERQELIDYCKKNGLIWEINE